MIIGKLALSFSVVSLLFFGYYFLEITILVVLLNLEQIQ